MSLTAWLADELAKLVEEGSWAGVFLAMVLESACLPIPSEVVMPLAGFALCDSLEDVVFASLIASAANLVGSWIAYAVGAKGGRALARRLARGEELERAERLFERYGGAAVFLGRMMPAVRTFISLPAGLFSMDPARFTLYTFAGSVPWNFALAYSGYLLGENWEIFLEYAHLLDLAVLAALLLAGAWFLLRARSRTLAEAGSRTGSPT